MNLTRGSTHVIFQHFRLLYTSSVVRVLVLVSLLAYLSFADSATHDEPSHLAAGIYDLSYGDRRCYFVNPPLVRMIAALPASCQYDASRLLPYVNSSPLLQWGVGEEAIWSEGTDQGELWISLGRILLIPFAVIGLIATESLAETIGCRASRAIAGWLYVTSPLLLSAGHSIAADGVCTSLICLLCLLLVRWARTPTWGYAVLAGVVLGLALLTKTLVLILTPVLLVATVLARSGIVIRDCIHRNSRVSDIAVGHTSSKMWVASAPPTPYPSLLTIGVWCLQGLAMVCVGLNILQFGYLMRGLMIPLSNYSFISNTLSGDKCNRADVDVEKETNDDNRFRGTAIGWVPIPLPAMYIYGIDRQKADMERSIPTFIAGEWRSGHWSDPIHVLLIKMPLAHTAVMLCSVFLLLLRVIRGHWPAPECLVAFLPAMAVIVLSMTQTGMTIFARYLAPALPLGFSLAAANTSNFAEEQYLPEMLCPPCIKEPRRRFTLYSMLDSILSRFSNKCRCKYRLSSVAFILLGAAGTYEVCISFSNVVAYQNLIFGSQRTGSTYFLGVDEYGQNLWRIHKWLKSHHKETPFYVSKMYYSRLVQLGHSQARELPGTKTLQEILNNKDRIESRGESLPVDLPEGWVVSTAPDRLGASNGNSAFWLRSKPAEMWIAPGLAVHWLEKEECVALIHMLDD